MWGGSLVNGNLADLIQVLRDVSSNWGVSPCGSGLWQVRLRSTDGKYEGMSSLTQLVACSGAGDGAADGGGASAMPLLCR